MVLMLYDYTRAHELVKCGVMRERCARQMTLDVASCLKYVDECWGLHDLSLSNLSVLRASVVMKVPKTIHHGGTENTKNVQKDQKHVFPTDSFTGLESVLGLTPQAVCCHLLRRFFSMTRARPSLY